MKILTSKDETIFNSKSWLSTVSNLLRIRNKDNLIFIATDKTNLVKWIGNNILKLNNF